MDENAMPKPFIFATIICRKAVTEYQGRVYEQDVWVKFPDNSLIDVFDPAVLVQADMIDKQKRICLSVPIAQLKKLDHPEYGIKPNEQSVRDQARSRGGYGHIFRGKIDTIDRNGFTMMVDVKAGKIFSHIGHTDIPLFSVGDFVEIAAQRTELCNISD